MWAQRLGSLAAQLDEASTPEAKGQAKDDLTEFVAQCPWRYLRENAYRKN